MDKADPTESSNGASAGDTGAPATDRPAATDNTAPADSAAPAGSGAAPAAGTDPDWGAPGAGAAAPTNPYEPPKKKKAKVRLSDKPPAVDIKGVTKRFGAVTAVNDVTLEVPDGSVFGLIGPNGAGKTTTFSMLAGYLSPTSGEIFILDRSPTAVAELKGQIGVLPQDALLPAQEKVGEFLLYLARLQGIAAAQAKSAVEAVLHEVEGIPWWNVKCGALSHGMAKRVGLAQALLGNPRVILLDEPTAGLDPRVAWGVRQIIKSRKGRATLIISSHNLQELEEICDHAAILDRGVLVAHGSMAELTASSSEIRIELARGPIPEDPIRTIPGVKTVAWDKSTREMYIQFDRQHADAEEMIRRVTYVLYQNHARISGISKGRGLEQRVMELTE